MSCYFRYMKDVLEEAGIVVSKENKQPVDEIIHSMAEVEYKDCWPAWDVVKQQIKNDPATREDFIKKLKKRLSAAKLI